MNNYDDIIAEAKIRFRLAQDFEGTARTNALQDKMMYHGDSMNCWQWDTTTISSRNQASKPTLTNNRIRIHCLQIINDARQSRPAIKIRASGNGASYQSAEVYESLCRHIEYISCSDQAYETAMEHSVVSGWGYFRICTDYVDDKSFDQEIYIRRIPDPLTVYYDIDIATTDGSDGKWCFIFKEIPKQEFTRDYPDHESVITTTPIGYDGNEISYGWITDEHVRVAEYFRIVYNKDKLFFMPNGMTIKESDIETDWGILKQKGLTELTLPQMRKQIAYEALRTREVETPVVEWYLIAGDEIIDEKMIPGKYIPVIPVIAEQFIVQGQMDRPGHVRYLADAQRIHNLGNSAAVEALASQSKIPFIASAESIEGHEDQWDNANTESFPYLLYNGVRDNGELMPPPQKAEQPTYPSGYAQMIAQSANDMTWASGQEPGAFGAESNERSAKAIQERVKGGDRSTFHYINRMSQAIRYAGTIIVGMIPFIYDTKRVITILAQDGSFQQVGINPDLPTAHQEVPEDETFTDSQVSQIIFNPTVGTYDITVDSGPNYASKRAEAFNAISMVLSQNESLSPIIGDFLFKMMDVPEADLIANRLRNMVPPQALGDAPNPQVVEMQKLLAQQHGAMTQIQAENQQLKDKHILEMLQKDIDQQNADTNRLKAMGAIDPASVMLLIREDVSQMIQSSVNEMLHRHMIEAAITQSTAQNIAQQNTIQQPQDQMQQGANNWQQGAQQAAQAQQNMAAPVQLLNKG